MIGYSKTGANLVYRQLLTNLTAYGNDPIELRIGGNSTDNTGRPSGDRMKPYVELANALHARFILGVNFGSNDLSLTENQVKFYSKEMPNGSIEAFEIGNEPDAYPNRKMRPGVYGLDDYLKDFDVWRQGILPLLPKGTLLAGPSWSGIQIVPSARAFLAREDASLGVLSLHFYAGSPYSNPPPDYLLRPHTATFGPALFATAVAAAHERHIPFRITELNSYYGAGVHGQSDAFSAALWSIDTMFEYVKAGVDGVNWEAEGGNFCSPFIFNRSTVDGMNTFTLKTATPLYFGLLFFQAATGRAAKLLPVDVDTHANLKAWATVDEAGRTRLAIINKDLKAQGSVTFQMPGHRQATVARLLAPSYTSLTGVTLGGQSLDGSEDGKLLGAEKTETIRGNNGQFELSMPVTSAALVTFSK
jgi:hypothetical protein